MTRKPEHLMRCYRGHILGCKRKWGSARALIHYLPMVREYVEAKRAFFSERTKKNAPGVVP